MMRAVAIQTMMPVIVLFLQHLSSLIFASLNLSLHFWRLAFLGARRFPTYNLAFGRLCECEVPSFLQR